MGGRRIEETRNMKEIKFTVPDISDLEIENVVEVLGGIGG